MALDFAAWFENEARCAEHAQAAHTTCARCGAFCCESCLEGASCAPCSSVLRRESLPAVARGVAWKLALAPTVLALSGVAYVVRGKSLPPQWLAWVVPFVCAVLVLRRCSAAAAWVGAVTSLLLLGWQAMSLLTQGAELRLLDVALLAIAPTFALVGAEKLTRLQP